MTIDLVRMRKNVRKPLGMLDETDSDLTTEDVDELLNKSFWEVAEKFDFREKECTGTFLTVIGTRNYNLPPNSEALRGIAIKDPTYNQHVPLQMMTHEETELLYDEDTSAQGLPQKFLRENCILRLWPTPDKVYTVTIRTWRILADFDETTNPTLILPRAWIEIIEFGAVWRGYLNFGDVARANAYKAHQISLINTIVPVKQKEIVDVRNAGLQVLSREY